MGLPEPPPLVETEIAFPKLKFPAPVHPVFANDGSDRVFVVTQAGQIMVFPNDPRSTQAKVFLDLREVVARPGGDNGMFGLAFHPKFRENREFFAIYIDRRLPKSTVISRFRSSTDDPDKADCGYLAVNCAMCHTSWLHQDRFARSNGTLAIPLDRSRSRKAASWAEGLQDHQPRRPEALRAVPPHEPSRTRPNAESGDFLRG